MKIYFPGLNAYNGNRQTKKGTHTQTDHEGRSSEIMEKSWLAKGLSES